MMYFGSAAIGFEQLGVPAALTPESLGIIRASRITFVAEDFFPGRSSPISRKKTDQLTYPWWRS
jgi:hypothetical protein